MKRSKIVSLVILIGCLGQPALAADGAKLTFDTYSGYFVSNKFEPDAAVSFVVITDQEVSLRQACMNRFDRYGIVGCQLTNLWRTADEYQQDA